MNKTLLTLLAVGSLVTGLAVGLNMNKAITEVLIKDTTTGEATLGNKAALNTIGKKVGNVNLDLDRTIVVQGEIGKNAVDAATLVKEMSQESNDPIFIILDSPGGSVVDGNVLVSAIESSKTPIYTVCHRICASMAAVIHQYGTKRYIQDRSILMFHSASAGTQGTVEQMQSFSNFLATYIEKTERFISKRANMDYVKYKELIQYELWLDAEESVRLNFADGIVTVNTNISKLDVGVIDDKKENKASRLEGVRWIK